MGEGTSLEGDMRRAETGEDRAAASGSEEEGSLEEDTNPAC